MPSPLSLAARSHSKENDEEAEEGKENKQRAVGRLELREVGAERMRAISLFYSLLPHVC